MRLAVIVWVLGIGLAGVCPADQHPSRNAVDRWLQMSPAERERELAKLPPARARQIRERLREYSQLPAEEKRDLRERYQRFLDLSPEKQAVVRNRLREFRELPAERRLAVRRAFEQLRDLPEAQRRERLEGPEFRNLTAQERQILSDVTEYLTIPAK